MPDWEDDPAAEHWKNPYPGTGGGEFCGHCGNDWPCRAVREESADA